MTEIIIRREAPSDYRNVENIMREAFWNLNSPGCDEHYLAHILRGHEDFLPELDLVAEVSGEVVANVMYTKSYLVDECGTRKDILTFGPIGVMPKYQRCGISKALLGKSFDIALQLGYDSIVIFGNPGNYVGRGFVSCKKHNICVGNGIFPTAMLVKELKSGTFDGRKWTYHESPIYNVDEAAAIEFDKSFPPKEKTYATSHEEFYIYSHSSLK